MDVILRSAEMFYVGASWNDKGSSWQSGPIGLNITVKPLHYIVERGKKMQENNRSGKELKYVRNTRKLQTMEIIKFIIITTKIINKKKCYINTQMQITFF